MSAYSATAGAAETVSWNGVRMPASAERTCAVSVETGALDRTVRGRVASAPRRRWLPRRPSSRTWATSGSVESRSNGQ